MSHSNEAKGKFCYRPLPEKESQGEFLLRLEFARLYFWNLQGFSWQSVSEGTAVVWYEELTFRENTAVHGQASVVALWHYEYDKLVNGMSHLVPSEVGRVQPFDFQDDETSFSIHVLRTENIVYFQWDEQFQISTISLMSDPITGERLKNFEHNENDVLYTDYRPPSPWWKFWLDH